MPVGKWKVSKKDKPKDRYSHNNQLTRSGKAKTKVKTLKKKKKKK